MASPFASVRASAPSLCTFLSFSFLPGPGAWLSLLLPTASASRVPLPRLGCCAHSPRVCPCERVSAAWWLPVARWLPVTNAASGGGNSDSMAPVSDLQKKGGRSVVTALSAQGGPSRKGDLN